MRRLGLIPAAALLLGLTACGESTPPLPTTTKTILEVPERYQRRDLAAWKALGPHAPAGERAAQAWALAALEPDPLQSAAILERLLADEDASVRLAAVVASGRLAPPSKALAAILVEFLASDDEPLRRHARAAVGHLGAAAVPALHAAARDGRTRVRWGAVAGLAHTGAAGAAAVPDLARLAREDPIPEVRRQARFTLPRLGVAGVRACLEFLGSTDAAERSEAATALGYGGAAAVAPLAAALTDDDEVVAALAAGVLADLGPVSAPAIAQLAAALRREGPVRFNAAEALMAIGEPARGAVVPLEKNADPGLAEIARFILERLDEAK